MQRPHSPPEYRQRGQYGQPPAALRLYHTSRRNKPPRIWTTWTIAPPCGEEEAAPPPFFCPVCSVCPFVGRITSPPPFRAAKDESPKAATRYTERCSVHTARPNIDNVDNMDTTARRVEATQARGGEYRKCKRPPPTNRERPKPQIKNERPKEQRARLCTNIQHEAKRNNRHALRLYGASRQEPKRYAPAYSPASSS